MIVVMRETFRSINPNMHQEVLGGPDTKLDIFTYGAIQKIGGHTWGVPRVDT